MMMINVLQLAQYYDLSAFVCRRGIFVTDSGFNVPITKEYFAASYLTAVCRNDSTN